MMYRPFSFKQLMVREKENGRFIIHSGGDNYSDVPKKLGGGGARVACGVVVN